MKYFAFILCVLLGNVVALGICFLGLQPAKVAGSNLELEMSWGSRIITQGAGTAHFTGCSFFELRDGNDTPIYGLNQSEYDETCAGTVTSTSVSLGSEGMIRMHSGRNVRVVIEASDDFILVLQYPGTFYAIFVLLFAVLVGTACFIFGMGLLTSCS